MIWVLEIWPECAFTLRDRVARFLKKEKGESSVKFEFQVKKVFVVYLKFRSKWCHVFHVMTL